MKILIVSNYYYPELGAAPSRIMNMAEGMRRLNTDVDVLTCLPNYPIGIIFDKYKGKFSVKEKKEGVNIFRYWTFATVSKNPFNRFFGMCVFGLTMWCFALKRKRIMSYDYVIIQSPPLMVAFSATLLFKVIYRKKTVLNVSDLWPLSAVELGAIRRGGAMQKVMLLMERYLYTTNTMFQGQSKEIIDHVDSVTPNKRHFLYRNLQSSFKVEDHVLINKPFSIIYAGLLGVAQDLLGIITNINFKDLGAEFHIYGGGNQAKEIEEYLRCRDLGVFYHGYLGKSELVKEQIKHHASIVPLTVRIKGAVPSKIFDLMSLRVPVLFCGGGEGAEIVRRYKVGLVSEPGDFPALKTNIEKLIALPQAEYHKLRENCREAYSSDFSFEDQIRRYLDFLSSN